MRISRMTLWAANLGILALAGRSLEVAQQAPAQSGTVSLSAPVQLTAEQDRARTMELLHITSLRRGADGRNPQADNAANYDEAKANPYPKLPDPLVLKNGKRVTTPSEWWNERRPEIVEDFDREIYGRAPKNTPKVRPCSVSERGAGHVLPADTRRIRPLRAARRELTPTYSGLLKQPDKQEVASKGRHPRSGCIHLKPVQPLPLQTD